jgi:DNA gyrase subunit A
LIVTENGFGKRTVMDEYRLQGRGGVGLITQKTTDKVGFVVSARLVTDSDQILLTTNAGQAIRMLCSDISVISRNTQGVKLMNLNEGEFVTSVALLGDEVDEGGSEPSGENGSGDAN